MQLFVSILILLSLSGCFFSGKEKIVDPILVNPIQFSEDKTVSQAYTEQALKKQEERVHDASMIRKAIVASDEKQCSEIGTGIFRRDCYDEVIYKKWTTQSSEILCKQIISPERQAECIDQIFFTNAVTNNSIPLCKKIHKISVLDECILTLMKQVINSSSDSETLEWILYYCDELHDDKNIACRTELIYKIDRLYLILAIRKHDRAICTKVRNKETQSNCINAFSRFK